MTALSRLPLNGQAALCDALRARSAAVRDFADESARGVGSVAWLEASARAVAACEEVRAMIKRALDEPSRVD